MGDPERVLRMHKNGLIVLAVTLGLAFVAYTYAMTALEVFGCS
jgi:hypothetical protein